MRVSNKDRVENEQMSESEHNVSNHLYLQIARKRDLLIQTDTQIKQQTRNRQKKVNIYKEYIYITRHTKRNSRNTYNARISHSIELLLLALA